MAAIVPRPGGDASSEVPMRDADRFQLLHGPYTPPALDRGDPAVCRYRDAGVIVTSWSDAPIPWPRCQVPGQRGGSGPLVDAELARAVRCESAQAIRFWWGVSQTAVQNWRRALGVERFNEGSRRLLNALNAELGAALKGKRQPAEQVRRRVATKRERGTLYIPQRWAETGWKPEQLALLGALPDEELAEQLGRTATAVPVKRTRLGIASACDRRRKEYRGLVSS
jgi:hypothetical protein